MNRPAHDEATLILNRWTGGECPRLLGQGMEGVVYEIDHDRVAKIWFDGSESSLHRDRVFYNALASKTFRFAVPRIHEVHVIDNRCVTIEQRLAGTNMTNHLEAGKTTLDRGMATFVDVLAELAGSGSLPEARALSVMDEDVSFYDTAEDFPKALGDLAERRLGRFRHVLYPAVEELDKKTDVLRDRLREIDSGHRSVIHGDLILDNILVKDDGTPAAVLDWGFFTTEGDPAFDAAVAASIFDMYGKSALDTELDLYDQIEERLGYQRDALLVYRAAYSLITANAYDADGNDGHFAWCVAALNRPDVVQALLG
ncbi:phosphotransferase family protein [Rhodococcus pyridinivorans]|uniref:Phosphotransferase n=1 Tax=Rhodococcus pyridinivorans TaxID=103816 RepID=A0A7M2XWB4_9NOCA|nr:phosphotransferase [Rhodococcus pyridinivorans]QOW02046.1 phosphotransferase [Rhodococcus pyridinivorans]